MGLAPDTVERISRHWAERLGCEPVAFREPGVAVVEGTSSDSIRLFRRDDALVVAAPVRDALERNRDLLRDAALPATEAVERALAADDGEIAPADDGEIAPAEVGIDAAHGPYALCYVDASSFSPVESDARLLVGADEPAFERLRERVPDEEWARASPVFRPGQTAGLFRDDELVAVATLTHSPFPDVGVVVAPASHGRGHGRAVVSAISATAFDADADSIVRYRTREASPASLALATSLGYERWATSAVIVLDQGPP